MSSRHFDCPFIINETKKRLISITASKVFEKLHKYITENRYTRNIFDLYNFNPSLRHCFYYQINCILRIKFLNQPFTKRLNRILRDL